jgi:hypothetical protein
MIANVHHFSLVTFPRPVLLLLDLSSHSCHLKIEDLLVLAVCRATTRTSQNVLFCIHRKSNSENIKRYSTTPKFLNEVLVHVYLVLKYWSTGTSYHPRMSGCPHFGPSLVRHATGDTCLL